MRAARASPAVVKWALPGLYERTCCSVTTGVEVDLFCIERFIGPEVTDDRTIKGCLALA
jgi:hypothetical protein